jgi:hypothetical protein
MVVTLLDAITRGLVRCGWSPVGKTAWMIIDDSGDPRLVGLTLKGDVRAFDLRDTGTGFRLLVELRQPIAYRGHYSRREIQWLVGESCVASPRTSLLPLSWRIVRAVDAPSFADSTYDRTIAIARLSVAPLAPSKPADATSELRDSGPEPTTESMGITMDERIAVYLSQIINAARSMRLSLDEAPRAHQLADIAMVTRQILGLAEAIVPRLPPPALHSSREPELKKVVDRIKSTLRSMDALRGHDYDQAFSALESFAAPYALALFYEICRLEEMSA